MSDNMGGARKGAGRKRNGHNRVQQEAIDNAKVTGMMPLAYLLSIMRDVNAEEAKRIDCAKAAAMYLHPKLSAIDSTISGKV